MQHEQATQWVSNQFQLCITDFWTLETERRTSLLEGKGWFWRVASKKIGTEISLRPESRKLDHRGVGSLGPSQKRAQCHHHCQDFPQRSTRLDIGTRSKQKLCPEWRVKVCIWFSEKLRRSLAQVLEFTGPFHGLNVVPSFVSSDRVFLSGSIKNGNGFFQHDGQNNMGKYCKTNNTTFQGTAGNT